MSQTTTTTIATLTTSPSLPSLLRTLHKTINTTTLPPETLSAITTLFQSYIPNPTDYLPYIHFDSSKPYTRNLLDRGNGFYNLMILCWTPGKQSPIHDHAGAHCLMKILDGELEETQYEWPDSSGITLKKSTVLGKGEVAYIHDKIGLHRISNPSSTKPAISLHLYTPPFEYCKTFDERTGMARGSGKCVFHKDFTMGPVALVGGEVYGGQAGMLNSQLRLSVSSQ